MFGYIKIDKPECKIREYEYYRGVYCGLCRALGKCGGQCARLTLTYDFAFLALVRMALTDEKPSFYKKRCIAHPLRRHTEAKPNASLEFCARASLLLSYHKLLDDLTDERGRQHFRARMLSPALRGMSRRAAEGYEALEKSIAERLSALSALEKDPPVSLDRPALLFGSVAADILAFGLEGEKARVASAVGAAVGKWVYLIDALDDLEEDIRLGRYNPIALVYGEKPPQKEAMEEIGLALDACLAEASAALDLIEFPDRDMRALTENILHFGMPSVIKKFNEKGDALS